MPVSSFINTTIDRDQPSYDRLIHLKDAPLVPIHDFFGQSNNIYDIYDDSNDSNEFNRKRYMVTLDCKMDRGFFFTSDCHWTCYRRNYFQVTASFSIPELTSNDFLALRLPSKMSRIQGLFVRLRACTSDNSMKSIALTQMTPKRDKGPQREPPILSVSLENSTITFERLQFKVATANNGKKRATQQYFRLVFELLAQLDDNEFHVVSDCYSEPLVVRGRSPGHYNSDPLEPRRRSRKLSEPQYIFMPPPPPPPPAIITNSSTPDGSFQMMASQNYFHTRSQSVNDTFHRQNKVYEQYDDNVGIVRALKNWRNQRQGTNDEYEDYMTDFNSSFPSSSSSTTQQWTSIQFKQE
ncbi:hypothetical protein G6F37_004340 [Rhizopus arrhizus]|nr:hypothetical protein G6F38_004509 [Rhizopus arrhizus]KAG1160052.1 hypothetical protein G6F37_004340 [Rhizopus arrhizus]